MKPQIVKDYPKSFNKFIHSEHDYLLILHFMNLKSLHIILMLIISQNPKQPHTLENPVN